MFFFQSNPTSLGGRHTRRTDAMKDAGRKFLNQKGMEDLRKGNRYHKTRGVRVRLP